MANPLVLKITVDDKGNPALVDMQSNIKKVDKHSSSLGKTMAKVFTSGLVIQAMYSFKNAIYNAGKEVMEFNKIFKQVEGVTGNTGKALNDLKLKTLAISNTTEHSATAVAMATLNIAKMGFTAKEALAVIPHIANLATASIVDLDTASSVAVQTMNSFGLSSNEMERIVNVMHGAISKTSIDFLDFSEAMKYVAPVAKTMNIGLEETAAMIGVLGNVGIKGSLGGTSLKNMFLNIMKPSENVKKVLEGLNEEGLTFTKILAALHEQKVPIQDFLETFDKRAVSGSLALSRLTAEIDKLKGELGDISALEAANIIRDAWIPQLLILKNVFINTFIVMGEILDQTDLGVSIGKITERFIQLQEWMRENPEYIASLSRSLAKLTFTIVDLSARGFELIIKNLDVIVGAFKVLITIQIAKWFYSIGVGVVALIPKIDKLVIAINALGVTSPIMIAATAALGLAYAFDKVTEAINKAERAKIEATWGTGLTQIETQLKAAKEFLDEYNKTVLKSAGTPWGKMDIQVGNVDELINKFSKLYNFKPEFFKQAAGFGDDFIKMLSTKLGKAEDDAAKAKKLLDDLFKIPKPKDDKGKAKEAAHITMMEYYMEALRVQQEMNGLLRIGFSKGLVTEAYTPQMEGISKKFPTPITGDITSFYKNVPKLPSTGASTDPTIAAQLALKMEFYGKDYKEAKKNLDKMDKDFKKFIEGTQVDLEGNAEWLAEYREKQKELSDEYAWNQFDAYAEAASMASEMMVGIYDFQLQKSQEKHAKELALLDERYNRESNLIQNNFYKKQILDRQYQKDKEKLAKQQEKIEKEYARKRKVWAIVEAAINTAVAVTKVFSSIAPPASFVLAAITAAAGIAQIAIIASQKEYFGGGYTGDGNPRDKAGIVHKREYVISHNRLSALGGKDNVEKMIDNHLNVSGTRYTNIYIDTFIGQREYERELFKRLERESARW